MKKIIHINQHVIKSNSKTGEREPVITVKTYKDNNYAHEVYVDGIGTARMYVHVYETLQ